MTTRPDQRARESGRCCVCRHVVDEAGFDALEAEWQRLEAANPSLGPFSGWDWNRLWWRQYAQLGELSIRVLEHDGTIVGIAPLYRSRTVLLAGFRPLTLRFIGRGGDTAPDDLDLLCEPSWAGEVAERLVSVIEHDDSDARWLLEDLSVDSALAVALRKRLVGRPHRAITARRRIATLPLSVDAWHASLSRNSRKHLFRRRRRADAAGRIHYRLVCTEAALDQAFADLVRLHRARRTCTMATSTGNPLSDARSWSFASEPYRALHRDYMTNLAKRGALRLLVLELDGVVIGVEYAFRHRDTLVFFQTGFDPAASNLSPGHLLMSHLFEHGIEEGVRTIDLLRGDYDYKASYAPDVRESITIDVSRSWTLAWLVRITDGLRGTLRRQLD